METESNPNEPSKPGAPGQQGGQQQDRDKEERERKADDKPSCLEVMAAGGDSRRFSYPRNSSDCDGFSAFVSCARGWYRIDFWKPSVLGYPKALKREQDLLHL